MNDAEGRKALLMALSLEGSKGVEGVDGHVLKGIVVDNPIGLPVENAAVPFELVIAKGDTPLLLSYAPDNTKLIEDFTKNRPQLGSLKVTMHGAFSDWKTGSDVNKESVALPSFEGFESYDTFEDMMTALQGGDPTDLIGKPAPDFELATADGGKFKLSDQKGQSVVILDFWATWCGPCVQAMPVIDGVAQAYEEKGVKLVAVNLRESLDEVKAFMEKHKLALAVAMDSDGSTAMRYKANSIPQTVIVGKDGVVAQVFVGLSPNLKGQLEKVLDGLG